MIAFVFKYLLNAKDPKPHWSSNLLHGVASLPTTLGGYPTYYDRNGTDRKGVNGAFIITDDDDDADRLATFRKIH